MGDRLYTEVQGAGTTVVLLHGLLSSTHSWDALAKKLAHTHLTIAIDLLGFGRSPKPKIAYTAEDQAQALHRTFQSVSSPPYILVGQSVGSVVALAYAKKYPQHIKKLVLINPPLFVSREEAQHQIKVYSGVWYFLSFGVASYIAHGIEQLLKPLLFAIAFIVPHKNKNTFLMFSVILGVRTMELCNTLSCQI